MADENLIETPEFVVRPLVEDDWNFVCKSWKKTYRHQEEHVPIHIYASVLDRRLSKYRYSGDAGFLVACDPENRDYILGWACVEGKVVHYTYVRDTYRRHGVARGILGNTDRVLATHWSQACEEIARDKPGSILYVPSRR